MAAIPGSGSSEPDSNSRPRSRAFGNRLRRDCLSFRTVGGVTLIVLALFVRLVRLEFPVMFHSEVACSVTVDVLPLSVIAAPVRIERVAVTLATPLTCSHSLLPMTLVLVRKMSADPLFTWMVGPLALDRALSMKDAKSELPSVKSALAPSPRVFTLARVALTASLGLSRLIPAAAGPFVVMDRSLSEALKLAAEIWIASAFAPAVVMKVPPGLMTRVPEPRTSMPIAFAVVLLMDPGMGPSAGSKTRLPPLTKAA